MSPDSPHHGKAWGFRQGCRCDDCKLAWSRKNKAWALRSHRNGGRTTVDVAEVREHLEVVLERMSQRAVGDIIGSSPGYVGRIARGDIKRVGIEREPSFWSRDDLVAEYEHLRSAGVSIHTAASQLGVTVGAIEKACERVRKGEAA